MKRCIVAAFVLMMLVGCSGAVKKSFKVSTDPSGADITVLSGPELTVLKFRSPATITAKVPTDPKIAPRAVMEVKKDDYKPYSIALRDIRDGQTLNIRLVKINKVRYRLSYRLASPTPSDTLQYRDASVAVSFSVSDTAFQLRFENLSPEAVKIVWDRAQYIDATEQPHQLMHSGIRFQERNNLIPNQIVQPRAVLQEGIFPIGNVSVRPGTRFYDVKPLFQLDGDAAQELKGKTIKLFIPVEVNRAIIAYNFVIEIVDVVKEGGKE
jgi:hypothetical protein